MTEMKSVSQAARRLSGAASGRLSILAFLGMAAGSVPIPYLPGAALRRVRGALAHDVAARYGLSLTDEARRQMSEPSRVARNGAFLATFAFFARRTMRRFGVWGLLPPAAAWLEVYALGVLFERYIIRLRASQTVRIDGDEASAVRRAIDEAVAGALSLRLSLPARHDQAEPTEELRDLPTRVVDGILLAVASLPDHLQRRLEAAFDAAFDRAKHVRHEH